MRVVATVICTGGENCTSGETKQGVFELDAPVVGTVPMPAGQYGPPLPLYDVLCEAFRVGVRKLTQHCTGHFLEVGAISAVVEIGVGITATYSTDEEHFQHAVQLIRDLGEFMSVIVDIDPPEEDEQTVQVAQPAAA